jgi:D-sedoheptulose 7-phosphate isomerase
MPMFPVAILAGGKATRLRPLTASVPKALLEINGEPFIAHQLRLLRAAGIERVVLCLGHLGEQIRSCVGDGAAFGLRADYSFDGPVLRGTAGAVANALPLLGDAFFVLYGDSYLPCDYRAVQEAFLRSGKSALMTVYRNQDRWDRSNVLLADGVIAAYDKKNRDPRMRHIDYGLGVFRRSALDCVRPGEAWDLAALYQDLLRRGDLAAWEAPERFYEIGSFEGLRELGALLAGRGTNMENLNFTDRYLAEVQSIVSRLDTGAIERLVEVLASVRESGGRLFILGVGGSAANASHAVNDFRKLAGIEAYAPTDNVSELTARTNDEGWPTVFEAWLRVSRLRPEDGVMVFSVGGGDAEQQISVNLVAALEYARKVGAKIMGIAGRGGGHTARLADACVIVPAVSPERVTPHSEAFQAVLWHLVVSHPALKRNATKWESVR